MSIFSTECGHCGSKDHTTDDCPHGFLESECNRCGSKNHATDDCPHAFLVTECGHCGSKDHSTGSCPHDYLSTKCQHCGSEEHATSDCPHDYLTSNCRHCGSSNHSTGHCPHGFKFSSGTSESEELDARDSEEADNLPYAPRGSSEGISSGSHYTSGSTGTSNSKKSTMRYKTWLIVAATLVILLVGLVAIPFRSAEYGNVKIIQLDSNTGRDIWTTSVFSFAPGGDRPGGGLEDEKLIVGGWGDNYHTLIKFNLPTAPAHADLVTLELFCYKQRGAGSTAMRLDRVTSPWDWRQGGTGRDRNRLWWRDRPSTTQWAQEVLPAYKAGEWYKIDVTTLYNAWQTGQFPNHGIQLQPVSIDNRWNDFYSSRNGSNPTLRPKLVIHYN